MRKKHSVVRHVIGAVCILLCLLLLSQTVYLPRYLWRRQPFDIRTAEHAQTRVMSANVRCYSPTDFGKRSWFYRAGLMVQTVASLAPDVIGFQEVTPLHYRYLTDTLSGYDSVIAYRDDNLLSEGCPVFYNTARFSLLDKGSFWLSETPERSSKDWGAAYPRVCSYVILQEKQSGRSLVVFNTHLDHVSDEARIRGVDVVLDKLRAFGDDPCILMGDLNAGEDSETYRSATARFDDAKYRTENPPKGPTYQNWGKALQSENIDYFLISPTGIDVSSYRIADTLYDGVYPSDHFPIVMDISLT